MALTKIGSIGINTGIQFAGVTTIATLNGSDSVLSVGGTVNFVSDVSIGGTVSIAGTLTYEDVTNIDAVGLITARNGIVVGSGITLSPDGNIFATGVTTSTSGIVDNTLTAGRIVFVDSDKSLTDNSALTYAVNGELKIRGTGEGGPQVFRDGGNGPDITLHGSRGTIASPTASAGTDLLGNINFAGYDGSAYLRRASINGAIDGTVVDGSNTLPVAIQFKTGATSATEKARIDSSGRILVAHTSTQTIGSNSHGLVQLNVNSNQTVLSLARFENVAAGPSLNLGKSRSSSAGSYTVVQDGDGFGSISFAGADGTDLVTVGAIIEGQVDGTPGSNDMPGRLIFSTTADGAASPTERLRINSGGHLGLNVAPGSWDSVPTFVALEGGGNNKHGSLHFQANGDWTTSLGCNHYYNGGWKYRHNGGASWLAMKEDELAFRLASSGSADGTVSWTDYFKIDSSGHLLNLSDSARIKLGAGQDFNFFHNGSDSVISNNTGNLYIENASGNASDIYIRPVAGENAITVSPNGAVHLYYDGASDSSIYSRYDGATIRNNNAQSGKDCNIDMIGQVDGNVQLHFYADNNTDNNKKFRVKADSGGESFKLESYYTGGWGYHLACTKGSNNTSNRRFHAGDGGIRFDNTCHDYRDIDGDGHLFRRDGQAQLGVDDFFYIHDISTSENNQRLRIKFDSNAGSGSPSITAEGSFSPNTSMDFAEYFEWSDGNPSNEDRIGHTVSVDGLTGKIKIAEEGETVIGVISGTAGFIAGSASFSWQGRFKRDEWGREVYEEQKDENGNLIYADAETRAQIVKTERIETSEYDSSLENSYVPRDLRKEWDIVGLLGQVRVRKTAVIPSNWIKLKEIDSVKDLYLVR